MWLMATINMLRYRLPEFPSRQVGLTCSMCSNAIRNPCSLARNEYIDQVKRISNSLHLISRSNQGVAADFDLLKKKVEDAGFCSSFRVKPQRMAWKRKNDRYVVLLGYNFIFESEDKLRPQSFLVTKV